MGEEERRESTQRRERDKRVILLLQSDEPADFMMGWKLLDTIYRRSVAKTLLRIAHSGRKTAYSAILNQQQRFDIDAFAELWNEIKSRTWRSVRSERFKFQSNFLAYMIKIGLRTLDSNWRFSSKTRDADPTDMDQFPVKSETGDDVACDGERYQKLLGHIDTFCSDLNERDRTIMKIGVAHTIFQRSKSTMISKIREAGVASGRDATLLRRYSRLRKKLRDYLGRQGYDV